MSVQSVVVVAGGGGSGAAAFVRHSVSLGPYGQVTQGNNVGDIDGDGRPDVVVGGDNYLVWYHNSDWAPHLIFQGPTTGGSMLAVADVNGDGRNDVVTGEQGDPTCSSSCQMDWFENT
ncbi:MAG: FG-GAP repeat domain-containing protein, partial [Solirubrobacteraceae bacterium]